MKAWRRATGDRCCGFCGEPIPRGAPVLELGPAKLRRCTQCADEAVPEDLPPLLEHVVLPSAPLVHILTGPNALPFDFKARQAGEREPGCDDD